MDKETPAFPSTADNAFTSGKRGMTLRDYFASNAMAALITCAPNNGDLPHDKAAIDAYRYAARAQHRKEK